MGSPVESTRFEQVLAIRRTLARAIGREGGP
jgi:hypothetical protein